MTPADCKNIFPFFKLPRELRDEIYLRALTTTAPVKVTRKWSPGLRAKAERLPASNLLRLSHRFSDEYREAARETSRLIVNDSILDMNQQIPIDISKAVSELANLQVNLAFTPHRACASCGEADSPCVMHREVDMHLRWLRSLLEKLPQLHAFSINAHISGPNAAQSKSVICLHLAEVTGLPGLDTITVYRNVGKGSADGCYFESVDKQAVLTWDQTDGKFTETSKGVGFLRT
ncbi:hypothetical protein LTR27_004582 [Elasticomyces elasticus]|nr:hypothetical protein LTR27_004582 [Elasticomyces elasticus]